MDSIGVNLSGAPGLGISVNSGATLMDPVAKDEWKDTISTAAC